MSHRQRQLRRRRRRGGRGRVTLLSFTVLGTVLAIGALSVVGYIVAIAATAPDIDELKPADKGASSAIYAADGSRLGFVQADFFRTPVPWREMPRHIRQAVVAIEDERFYEHKGVDYEAIVRAAIKNLESGETLQGGSTITQQLVRALYIEDPAQTLDRKIREAKLASELEKQRPKRWILREYLNSVPFGTVNGRTALGIEAAASVFFGKHAKDLTLEESALLAGLPQAPSRFNPLRNPRAALQRRNDVIRAMVDNGFITPERAKKAIAADLGLDPGDRYLDRREPFFFDFVQERLIEKYGVNVYRRGGLKVKTTIDPDLQEQGRKAIEARLNQAGDPSAAVLAIDPSNGYIRAMASSGTYGEDRTFNLAAQGHRQPGSAFKPFALVTALRRGVNPRTTTYVSKPLKIPIPNYGTYDVSTYGNQYYGNINLVEATLRSDNTVYVQLASDLGPQSVADTAHLLGIDSKLNGYLAETLGGLELGVSPLEMASAYATLASGGVRSEPIAITEVEFPDGKVDKLGEPQRKRVISDGVAYETTRILEQNIQRGTGTSARIGCPAAGKTGTTEEWADAWFVGYTPKLATAVWVGYPNSRKPMRSVHGIPVTGGSFPAQIWGDFMSVAKGDFCGGFRQPSDPVDFKPFDGKYARSGGAGTGGYGNSAGGGGGGGYGYSPPAGGGTGGAPSDGYDPRHYESQPQPQPEPEPAPQPEPQPQPTPEGGGGQGGGPPQGRGPGGGGPPGGGGGAPAEPSG